MSATATHTAWVPEWSFGDRIRKVRVELGMDQREFAAKLGIKAPTLSSYEAGRANPRARDLPKLASRLELLTGVPRSWFMGWNDSNPRTLVPKVAGSTPVGGTLIPFPTHKIKGGYATPISGQAPA